MPMQTFAFLPRVEEKIVLSFSKTSSTLGNANKVALERHLPRINSINLEIILIRLWTSQTEEQRSAGKFNQLNIKREQSIRDFFINAGIPNDRIYFETKSLNSPAATDANSNKQRTDGLVEIAYLGSCIEGHQSMCFDEGKGKTECLEKGGTWDRTGRRPYGYCVLDTEEKCVSRGGIWGRVCLSQSLMCVRKFDDGGKACSDSKDCESRKCVAVGREANEQGVTVGECVRTSDPCGSFNFIVNGKPTGSISYD